MGIDLGIALDCAALVEVGGLQNIFVTDLDNIPVATAVGTDTYSVLAGTVPWAMFQLKPNTATWGSTSSKENGITKFETTIQWYIPNIKTDDGSLAILQNMTNKCIVAVAEFRSGVMRTCGISETYQGFGDGADHLYNSTYATMTVEETSGADFVDGNGATVTLVATSFETPRLYTGGVTYGAANNTAVLV